MSRIKNLTEKEFVSIKLRQADNESVDKVRLDVGRSWNTINKVFKTNTFQEYSKGRIYEKTPSISTPKRVLSQLPAPDQQVNTIVELRQKQFEMNAHFDAVIGYLQREQVK